MRILRAGERFRSVHDGITSWHCFSAGAHYDPDNTAFGRIVAVDEHLLAPGAGFDWHAHAGVTIWSWVLDGRLRHEDDGGDVRMVGPGEVLAQATGDGVRHTETNASVDAPLRFVQTTALSDGPSSVRLGPPPVEGFRVVTGRDALDGGEHVFVARGEFVIGDEELHVGDSARTADPVAVRGEGELLVVAAG